LLQYLLLAKHHVSVAAVQLVLLLLLRIPHQSLPQHHSDRQVNLIKCMSPGHRLYLIGLQHPTTPESEKLVTTTPVVAVAEILVFAAGIPDSDELLIAGLPPLDGEAIAVAFYILIDLC
jgi:hypothetical protein